MSEFLERISDEWRERAPQLAEWTMQHLVNRTDVWGRYLAKSQRRENNAVTAPFRDERGKVFLNTTSLQKHYKTRRPGGVLGVHSASADLTSRWLALDVDLHEPDDLSVTPEGNFVAVRGWRDTLAEMGFDPLLMDSNGRGGFHLLVVFAEPLDSRSVHAFGKRLVADFEKRGLDQMPEIFPGKTQWNHYGNWLRLPGKHHTHDHYTRVWNDEPWADALWLDGYDAIERIVATRPATIEIAEQHGMQRKRRTICLDFDGVIHSYRSGWCGAEVIPDPPVHGSRKAIARLRSSFRVVVHSARCVSEEGCKAIEAWLRKHDIEVDEVCRHKPPAFIYVDDRAVPFQGDWDRAISDIHDFRR